MARKVDPERAAKQAFDAALLVARAHQAWVRRDEVWQRLREYRAWPGAWNDELLVLADKYLEAGVRTDKDAHALDGQFASMTKPPVLPLFYTERPEYTWDEQLFNSTYQIRVEREEFVDAGGTTHVVIHESGNRGSLIGRVNGAPWPAFAMLDAVPPGLYVAARTLDVWCRILAGYGVDTWRIEAYEERRRFWQRLVVTMNDQLEIVAEGTRTAVARFRGECR